jgi:DNA recombination protein RmuC
MLESLKAHTDAVHAGMDVMAESQQRQLDAIRADNTRQLEQARTAVEDKLESALERRLGESFSRVGERLDLVSERLEQVHRGLGEVQTFAAGLGNLQRALANVRLGGTKTRANPAAATAEEGDAGPRAVRRKPKRAAGDNGLGAVDTPHASSP